jgi:hypothetical protein
MTLSLRVFSLVFAGVFCCGSGWAQSKDKSPVEKKPRHADVLEGTPVKRAPVTSDDSITRLEPNPPAGHAERTAKVADAAGEKEASATTEDADRKAAQIASLEKHIQDKQKRILLLMRLFVTDEQGFLRNPGDSQDDREIKSADSPSRRSCTRRRRDWHS